MRPPYPIPPPVAVPLETPWTILDNATHSVTRVKRDATGAVALETLTNHGSGTYTWVSLAPETFARFQTWLADHYPQGATS